MSKKLRITGKELISLLKNQGFEVKRIKGSHHFLKHIDGSCTTVPVHKGEIIGPGLFAKILNDCDLTQEDLLRK